ncbi:MAG: hypothetical protein ABIR24_15090 [Verrucomicrobiota bacterium]
MKIESASAPAVVQTNNVIDVSNAPLPVTKFHWHDIESEDYPAYIANLRAVRCPEKTIFGILFADIEKLFAERKKRLESERTFWLAGDDFEMTRLAREKRLFDLLDEKRALIKTLLHSDLDWEIMQSWYEEKLLGLLAGFVPDAEAERALSVAKKFVDRIEKVDQNSGGLLIPEDAEEKNKRYAEMKSVLGLASADLEEGELRMICLFGNLFSNDATKESNLTGQELRQITQLKQRFDNPLEHELLKYDGNDSGPEELSKQKFFEEVKSFLGEVRFQRFLRAHDRGFEQLCNLAEENGLRPQITMALFEVQSAATLAALQMREDTALPRKERWLQLQAIEQSTREAIEQMLGEKMLARYSTNVGDWLKELGRP